MSCTPTYPIRRENSPSHQFTQRAVPSLNLTKKGEIQCWSRYIPEAGINTSVLNQPTQKRERGVSRSSNHARKRKKKLATHPHLLEEKNKVEKSHRNLTLMKTHTIVKVLTQSQQQITFIFFTDPALPSVENCGWLPRHTKNQQALSCAEHVSSPAE